MSTAKLDEAKSRQSHVLRQAATLALTKLMCVSAQYCENHLLLLFKILETSKDPIVRSNIVIALGDIAVCWGSMIDDVGGGRTSKDEADSLRTRNGYIKVWATRLSSSRRTP